MYSPAGPNYPETHLRDKIRLVEGEFWREYAGADFKEYVFSKLTAIPTGSPQWEDGIFNAEGDIVIRQDCLFKSLEGCNGEDPLNSDKWEQVKKFTTSCMNEFYYDYLRPYLAYKVYMGSLVYTTHQSGAGGLVIRGDDGSRDGKTTRVAKKDEIILTNTNLETDVNNFSKEMYSWLSENKKTCGFPDILALSCGNVSVYNPPRGRRLMMRSGRR